ncbi:MAG: hypothetical protein ACLP50_04775 [Solirubrobacteraceae bacterium]
MSATRLQSYSLRAALIAVLGALALVHTGTASAAARCRLGPGGSIQHVIIVQFDNVHLQRDNPNVPSDIEQIPALYDFMTDNGTLLANDHTVLISHTSDGILSTETGLYPDDFGGGVGNDFAYLDPDQTKTHASSSEVPGTSSSSLFTYWTDPTSGDDPLYTLIHGAAGTSSPEGVNTPAPWVAFTRAGCDFAGIGAADMELENDTSDLTQVFGASSTRAALGNWSYNTAYDQYFDAGSNLGTTDFEGLAVHCSQADSVGNGICSPANGGTTDALPGEPGGYSGYNALFGALAVDPILTGTPDTPLPSGYTPTGDTAPPPGNWQAPPIYDVFAPNADNSGAGGAPDPGNVDSETTPPPSTYTPGSTPTTEILDDTGNPGFPGFDGMEANNALGYTAAAQEAGIPVTYTYISDVHDDQYDENHDQATGPGEADHEAQLREYNAAFAAFFNRLANDGITKRNTVFLFTVDEGDHYAGGPPLNSGCNGVTVACEYDTAEAGGAAYGTPGYERNVGEVDVNLAALANGSSGTTKFGFDNDDAPAIIVPNQTSSSGPRPGPDDPVVRSLERTISQTSEFDPIVGTDEPITDQMADETEESILHMVNADPNRTPTFTLFGNPDFYFQSECTYLGSDQGRTPAPVTDEGPGCPAEDSGYAWNHGDVQSEIANTWQGWVGPGIANLGLNSAIWTDHTDVRPTLMTLLGLRDDYTWDGRAIEQMIDGGQDRGGGPGRGRGGDRELLIRLGNIYKQLDAPFGEFGLDTLSADTAALASDSGGDATYLATDQQLQTCESSRSALVARIQAALAGVETGRHPLDPFQVESLIWQARRLIDAARRLSDDAGSPRSGPVCG